MPYRNAGDDDESWQPGDYSVPPQNSPPPYIHCLLSDMQSAITTEIKKVDSLCGRVNKLEDDVKEHMLNASVSSSSPSTDSEGLSKQRK